MTVILSYSIEFLIKIIEIRTGNGIRAKTARVSFFI